MENNEDQPDDVKKATPVESTISDGNKDEYKESTMGKKQKSSPEILNDGEQPRKRRCNSYKGKLPSPAVTKNKKPCHPKTEIICRDNLTKYEYIDVLSTPKKSRGLSCKQPNFESTDPSGKRSTSSRKPSCKEKAALPQPISQRLEELAKPKPSHVMDLLKTWGSRLRPEIIDSVQKSLEENCAMSPEQMEAYYNEKDRENCSHVHRIRRKKCPGENRKKKSSCDDDHMDPETVCEEYAMAQRFVRHIISHLKNCPFAPEDHYDLTEVILSQLGNVLDYRPSGDGDRKFQMMFILANGIACWVHGMNVTVAEKLAKQQAQDAKEEIETEESEDEDNEEEEQSGEVIEATEEDEEEEDEDEGKEEKVEDEGEEEKGEDEGKEEKGEDEGKEENEEEEEFTETHTEPVEEENGSEEKGENDEEMEKIEVKIEPEEDDLVPESESDVVYDNEPVPNLKEEDEVVDTDERTNAEEEGEDEDVAQENEKEEESVDVADEIDETEPEPEISEMEESEIEEVKEVEDETTEEIAAEEEETIEEIPSIESMVEPGLAIQGLGEGDLFASDIPFLTFGKIMEILVKFLYKFEEAETTEVRRRLENAILKKLTNLVLAEAPDALDDNMKAVLEVLAENIAAFMEATLPKSKVNEVQTMAPEIESTEIRNWSHWLETVMDNATNWGKWIHEKVGEAEEKARTKVTRGDWQNWTSSFNSEALRWRIFNLDTKHRMHHADLNLTHKKVVHRGGMRTGNVMGSATLAPYPEKDEAEINAYDLSEEAKSLDQYSGIIDKRTS